MNEKFTPGPWVADSTHCRTAINSVATSNHDRKHIAMVNLSKNPQYEITEEEHYANAHLMVAAPDMYSVLSSLEWVESYEYHAPYCPCCDHHKGKHADNCKLQAALKKARGEE